MAKSRRIPSLSFRDFFTYEQVHDFLKGLVATRPELCRLDSLGPSREGREIWVLTVTDFETGAPEDKPAYLIHGNIHAGEVAGTHTALYTARQLLADARRSDLLKRVVFYIVPRLNPDGAEHVVTTCGRVRSREDWHDRQPNRLYQEDVNRDGLILTMRQVHPDGAFAKDPDEPRLMIARRADSVGPFYRVLPEGLIHDWDGSDRIGAGGRSFDWNRNWSYDWRPEPEQGGAGDFPFSEVEMRHMGAFVHSRPNLFGVLGYHTGPAAVLRPPSTGSLAELDAGDDRMMQELAQIGSTHTGFPVVPVVKYHRANDRDVNLRGHFHNFGYHHLGLFVFEFELGTIINSAGISTEEQFAVDAREKWEAHQRRVLAWWDKNKRKTRLFQNWKRFDHPQLGSVEIGGFLTPYQINPTLPDLAKIAKGTYAFTLAHAERHPKVCLEGLAVDGVGGGVYRIRARIANRGALPTHVTNKGRLLSRLKPVRIEFRPAEGVTLLSSEGHVSPGHLSGPAGGRLLEWFVKASGRKRVLCEIDVLGGTGGNTRLVVNR